MFHDYVLSAWQAGALKIAMLAFGIIIGSTWPKFFKKTGIAVLLWIVFVALITYLVYSFWPQIF